MKLRFRNNTLRLRLNRREVETLAAGRTIREEVLFPNQALFTYALEPGDQALAGASFDGYSIRVAAPLSDLRDWACGESIGLYFDVPADSKTLKISIEKDLECVDGPLEERDPEAFARLPAETC